jgi:TolB-like protein
VVASRRRQRAQLSGEAVRIAARLTRADSGEELWSENFTRDLKDVFAVQIELAETIVHRCAID